MVVAVEVVAVEVDGSIGLLCIVSFAPTPGETARRSRTHRSSGSAVGDSPFVEHAADDGRGDGRGLGIGEELVLGDGCQAQVSRGARLDPPAWSTGTVR